MAWTRNWVIFCLLVTGAVALALKRPRQHDAKALAAMRGSCQDGQFEWYGGGCASIISTITLHTPAEVDELCQAQGLHLPSVHSVEESLWFRDTAKSLGLRNIVIGLVPGDCQWFDGTDFDFDYMTSGEKCSDDFYTPIRIFGDGDGHWTRIGDLYVYDDVICARSNSTPTPITIPPGLPTCGLTPVQPNLSNERKTAVPYSWPWQIVLCSSEWYGGCSLECGGTIIDNKWVMTAGHCVYDDMNPKNYQVKAAVYQEDDPSESGEQITKVKAIHLNPKYKPDTHSYDISLIELWKPFEYTGHIQPICLPCNDTTAIAKPNSAYITGWQTTDQGDISIQLRQVKVPFVDYPTCEKENSGKLIEKTMVCAGEKGMDSCQGDSGGPMIVQGASGRWFQVGIVSWRCGENGDAGIYARVTAFCDFIASTTSGKVSCQPMA